MSVKNEVSPPSRPNTSWARVASNVGPPQQQQPSSNGWPTIVPSAGPQPDTKQARTAILEGQLQTVQTELEREQESARKCVSQREEAEAKMRKLENNLENARKKLLGLQPPQDISDDQVKQAFDDLCHNIEDWVDIECESLSSLEGLFSTNDWTNLEMKIAEHHITEDDIKLSEDFPEVRSNIIMNAVFSFVYRCCLSEERWGTPVDTKEETLLNELVEVMSIQNSACSTTLAPELQSGLKFTNSPQLRRWRSETSQAFQNNKNRAHIREGNLKVSVQQLRFMLKHFADKRYHVNYDKLRSKIIEPAYALADIIKASTSGYKFDFIVNSSSSNTFLEVEDVTLYRLVDACTGVEESVVEKHRGSLGRLRLCVFPALQKIQDSGERSLMSKALVVLDKSSEVAGTQTVALTEQAKESSEDGAAIGVPSTPKGNGSPAVEKQESPNGVLPEKLGEKDIAQASTALEKQPIEHNHSWADDEPKERDVTIFW